MLAIEIVDVMPIADAEKLAPLVQGWFLGGSRVTCNPPVETSDRDIIIQTADAVAFAQAAEQCGFTMGGSMPPEECARQFRYVSMRRGTDNIIFTDESEFFDRFYAATTVATRLNLLSKDDRIALFQAVLYGNAC